MGILQRGEIADDEYFRVTGKAEVGLNQDASSAIGGCSKFFADRRGGDSSRPEDNGCRKARVSSVHGARFNLRHGGGSANLNSQMI